MHCCGRPGQVVDLAGGDRPLRLVRCTVCTRREWLLGREAVPADAAFEVLAATYRSVPAPARQARSRAGGQTAARAAVRASRARDAAAEAAAAAAVEDRAGADRARLADLLQGWAVLGRPA